MQAEASSSYVPDIKPGLTVSLQESVQGFGVDQMHMNSCNSEMLYTCLGA